MKEILFRGKTLTGRWVEGAYYKQEEFYGDKEDAHIIITSKENLTYDQALEFAICTPETVGQFVGLTDKNGKKIFEGDIVFISGDVNETCVCIWEEDNFDYEFENETMSIYICGVHKDEVEVIGNIHDNPELLGGDYCG
jgi:uncharacterized phage protein (TIGR01671 family)